MKKISPKGTIPVLSRWLGSLWVLYFVLAGIYAIYLAWQNEVLPHHPLEFVYKVFASIAGALLLVLPFSLPGLLVAGLFPTIQIGKLGIRYSSLFLGGLVRWDEIQTVAKVKRPTECLAVVFSRPFGILNGWWFSIMHGRLAGVGKPVLLISMNWEERDELLQMIRSYQNGSSVN